MGAVKSQSHSGTKVAESVQQGEGVGAAGNRHHQEVARGDAALQESGPRITVESFDRVGGSDYLDELAMKDPPLYCRLLMRVLPSAIVAETPNAIDLGAEMVKANARVATMKNEP